METQAFKFAASRFVPVAIGFFGLSRGFLELGSAAVTGVAGVSAMTGIASAQEQELMPEIKTGKSTHLTDPTIPNRREDQ